MLIDLNAGLVTIEGDQVATFEAYQLDAGEDHRNDQIDAPAEDITYLAEIRVSPEHRRKGVMRSVINRLAEQGRPIVISPLPIDPDSIIDPTQEEIEELRGWYRRLGFVDQGHLMRLSPCLS